MLATGLLILKWIGMILLGILGLVLTMILLVLFVPVRYRARGSYYEELKGKASVSWLLHILSLSVVYDGEPNVAIRIFGIRMKSREKKDDANFDEKPVKRKRQPAEAATEEEQVTELMASEVTIVSAKSMTSEEPHTSEKSVVTEELITSGEPVDESAQIPPQEDIMPHEQAVTHEERSSRRSKAGKKFSFSFRRICDKLKEIKEQKDNILEFLGKEENKASFKLIRKQFKALLKHILPTRAKGKVRFGFDDPYTTGQVLMYISPFYGVYAKTLTVIPVFEDVVIEGELTVRGRVRIGTVLFRIGLLALDKNIRKIWRQLMNH